MKWDYDLNRLKIENNQDFTFVENSGIIKMAEMCPLLIWMDYSTKENSKLFRDYENVPKKLWTFLRIGS